MAVETALLFQAGAWGEWLLPKGWSCPQLCQELSFTSVSMSSKWAAVLNPASPAVKGLEKF